MSKAIALDTGAILLFVAIGGRSHGQSNSVSALLEIAAPFLIALCIAWLISRAWEQPTAIRTALLIWPITMVIGIGLRRFAFERGIATGFIIVSTAILGLLFVGWRGLHNLVSAQFGRTDDLSADL